MRLLNTVKIASEPWDALETFLNDARRPPYAILSHTWSENEISFQDIQRRLALQRPFTEGYAKIEIACRQAQNDGFDYLWIDTCCIDKSSSSELSEAINPMFRWYREAGICYAYLTDVTCGVNARDTSSAFAKSRWFTRGWTLQELLAPRDVVFYANDWSMIGTKRELVDSISTITKIDSYFLRPWICEARAVGIGGLRSRIRALETELPEAITGRASWKQHEMRDLDLMFARLKSLEPFLHNTRLVSTYHGLISKLESFGLENSDLRHASVAARMSWAATRQTTRPEDTAYCLLGIFGINMALLYGEGSAAFIRLQEEIIKQTDDQSLFAWGLKSQMMPTVTLSRWSKEFGHLEDGDGAYLYMGSDVTTFLAQTPELFANSGNVIPSKVSDGGPVYQITNQGLQISLPLSNDRPPLAVLSCLFRDDPTTLIGIKIASIAQSKNFYGRHYSLAACLVDRGAWFRLAKSPLHLKVTRGVSVKHTEIETDDIDVTVRASPRFSIQAVHPKASWSGSGCRLTIYIGDAALPGQTEETLIHIHSKMDKIDFILVHRIHLYTSSGSLTFGSFWAGLQYSIRATCSIALAPKNQQFEEWWTQCTASGLNVETSHAVLTGFPGPMILVKAGSITRLGKTGKRTSFLAVHEANNWPQMLSMTAQHVFITFSFDASATLEYFYTS